MPSANHSLNQLVAYSAKSITKALIFFGQGCAPYFCRSLNAGVFYNQSNLNQTAFGKVEPTV